MNIYKYKALQIVVMSLISGEHRSIEPDGMENQMEIGKITFTSGQQILVWSKSQFYLYDVDGKLLHREKIEAKEEQNVSGSLDFRVYLPIIINCIISATHRCVFQIQKIHPNNHLVRRERRLVRENLWKRRGSIIRTLGIHCFLGFLGL